MLIMRPEQPMQYPAIHRIHEAAFGRAAEADLVDALRKSPAYIRGLGIVAQEDRQAVGHILFTRIGIDNGERILPAAALAPLAVLPDWQNAGIGGQLVRYGLQKCEELGFPLVVVLGHKRYYPRFGFEPAQQYGISFPVALDDPEHLMVCAAQPSTLKDAGGVVRYPPEFGVE